MSKERASMLLTAALYKEDPEEMKALIRAARAQLSTATGSDPINFIELTFDQIRNALAIMARNLPAFNDSPEDTVKKFAICEIQLATIKEYATQGLKARTMGSGEAAELMLQKPSYQMSDQIQKQEA